MPVPAAETAPLAPAPAAKAEAKKTPRPERWFMKAEGGEEYGPISRSELDAWHAEGRVTADCQLLREGSEQWRWASEVYPELEQEESAAVTPEAPAAALEEEEASDEPAMPLTFAVTTPSRPATAKAKSTAAAKGGASRGKKAATPAPAEEADDDSEAAHDEISTRSKAVAGLLGIFLGPLGIHRFYLGYVGIGLAMLFTGGGCGIWSLLDAVFILLGKTPDADGRELRD